MNEQQFREAVENLARGFGWGVQSVAQLLEQGTFLNADGKPFNEENLKGPDSVRNDHRVVAEAPEAKLLRAMNADLEAGKAVFFYRAGEEMPRQLQFNEAKDGLRPLEETVKPPQPVEQPGRLARFWDGFISFFGARLDSCARYEQYVAEKAAYEAMDSAQAGREAVDPVIQETKAAIRAEQAEYDQAIVGSAERLRSTIAERKAAVESQYSDEAIMKISEKMVNDEAVTLEERQAFAFKSNYDRGPDRVDCQANALSSSRAEPQTNLINLDAFYQAHPEVKEAAFKAALNGSNSPVPRELRAKNDFVVEKGPAKMARPDGTGVTSDQEYERYFKAIANVRGHLDPATRLQDVNYLRELFVRHLGVVNDKLRAAGIGDHVVPGKSPDAVAHDNMVLAEIHPTMQLTLSLGKCVFQEGGVRTPQMAAMVDRARAIYGFAGPIIGLGIGRDVQTMSINQNLEMAPPKSSVWHTFDGKLSPQQRMNAVQEAAAVTAESYVAPMNAYRMMELSPEILTPAEAQNFAAREMVARFTMKVGEPLQEMANVLATNPQFIAAAGDDPTAIADMCKSKVLEDRVKEIAKAAVEGRNAAPQDVKGPQASANEAKAAEAVQNQEAEAAKVQAQAKPPVA